MDINHTQPQIKGNGAENFKKYQMPKHFKQWHYYVYVYLVMCCVRVLGPFSLEYECQRKGELGDEKYSSPMGLVSTILCTIVNHQSSQQPIGSSALEAANMILF